MLYTDFDKELDNCHININTINTIQDLEIIRDVHFSIFDKYNLGYTSVNICLYEKNNPFHKLILNCDRNTIFYIKYVTKLDDMDDLCLDYNKYCFYNIDDFDQFKKDYKNFVENNDTSFLEYWYKGDKNDSDNFNKHIKKKNINF